MWWLLFVFPVCVYVFVYECMCGCACAWVKNVCICRGGKKIVRGTQREFYVFVIIWRVGLFAFWADASEIQNLCFVLVFVCIQVWLWATKIDLIFVCTGVVSIFISILIMLTREPKPPSFLRRAAVWSVNNKFVSFLVIFTAVYIATIPVGEPKVSTSTERAEGKKSE